MLRRKIDRYLSEWKNKENRKPLIISGMRQVGKSTSVSLLGEQYESFIDIDFITRPEFKGIFSNGYEVQEIIKLITLFEPDFRIIPGNTLIFFDEIQEYPDAITSLKPFAQDGRFDVICSGSMLGINYKKISSVPVGFKEEYQMTSMDFEEFLWAKGYDDSQIDTLFSYMKDLRPLPEALYNKLDSLYKEYTYVGGLPEVVDTFIREDNYSNVFSLQQRIYKDYEDDITKYVEGLDYAKVERVYRNITPQLAKDNHKFQYGKMDHSARSRDYLGCEEWLKDAGIINVAYNLNELSFPFELYKDSDHFRIYYSDHSLFMASLDKDARDDVIINDNMEIYKGSYYESLISESLVKQGYELFFYKAEDAQTELDFVIRNRNNAIAIEVKRTRGRSKSLRKVLDSDNSVVDYGIKFSRNNIGYDDRIFTFPYFFSFLLSRFLDDNEYINWKK